MNREDIIRMAREAGFEQLGPDIEDWVCFTEEIERFAALVAAASDEKWKQAVISELVCCHIYNAAHDNDPRKALHDAISWNVQVALDPQVSSDAQALIDRGAAAEREPLWREIHDAVVKDSDKAYELLRWAETEMRYSGWGTRINDQHGRTDVYEAIVEFLK